MRQPRSLEVRLKSDRELLTPDQQKVYDQQVELQSQLRTYDALADHIDQLQAEYTRNGWQEDSHWFGLDDKKFLQDIQSKNLHNVSEYDKFRVLSTIDKIRAQNPDVFTKNINDLTPAQRQLREMVDGRFNETTGKHEDGLEKNVRTELAQRLRHEVDKLDIALSNQQNRQGVVGNAADTVVGYMGPPGGWGGIFMDSDATSQTVGENLEIAGQATQNLLALSKFEGGNTEFARIYRDRVRTLSILLDQTNENLNKMAAAHKGRVEGISDIVQVAAALSTTLACASAAPETFGGSLAAIPVVAPMAAGVAGKVTTKMLEFGTFATDEPYTLPDVVEDSIIAGITSSPFLPGNVMAKPLFQAEPVVAQTTLKPLVQQLREAGINFVRHFSELTPKTAAELTVKYGSLASKRTTAFAMAGGIDGATIEGTRSVIQGEEPLSGSAHGLVSGMILGPVIGPAIKYGGNLMKRGAQWLRAPSTTSPAPRGQPESTYQ